MSKLHSGQEGKGVLDEIAREFISYEEGSETKREEANPCWLTSLVAATHLRRHTEPLDDYLLRGNILNVNFEISTCSVSFPLDLLGRNVTPSFQKTKREDAGEPICSPSLITLECRILSTFKLQYTAMCSPISRSC